MKSDFWLFESAIWLHVLARSMIAIFVPILMLSIGFTLVEVILYYFIYHAFDVPLNFVARRFIQKWGARKAMIIANIATIVFFVLLSQLTVGVWGILVLMAFFDGVYDSFYWVAHLFLFMESNHEGEAAKKDTSILYIVKRVAGLLGPAIGAFILVFISEAVLIYVTITLLILSIIPLLKAEHLSDKPTQKQLSWREFFKDKTEKGNYAVFTLFTLHRNSELLIWPLFVFLSLKTIESVAMLPIIISIVAIMFSYVAGKMQKKTQQTMIVVSIVGIILVWTGRMFFTNEIFLYLSVFIVGMFSIFVSLPIDSSLFQRGKEKDILSASMWRNVLSMSIRTVIFAVLFITLSIFNFSVGIAVVGLLTLLFFHKMYKFPSVEKAL